VANPEGMGRDDL